MKSNYKARNFAVVQKMEDVETMFTPQVKKLHSINAIWDKMDRKL